MIRETGWNQPRANIVRRSCCFQDFRVRIIPVFATGVLGFRALRKQTGMVWKSRTQAATPVRQRGYMINVLQKKGARDRTRKNGSSYMRAGIVQPCEHDPNLQHGVLKVCPSNRAECPSLSEYWSFLQYRNH